MSLNPISLTSLTKQELDELPPPEPLTPRPKPSSQQIDRFEVIEDGEDLNPCERAANLLDSCMSTVVKPFGSNLSFTTTLKSEVVLFAVKTLNMLQKEACCFSQKCIDVHQIFHSRLLDLSIDLYAEGDCQKIREHWHKKGKAIFSLIHNGKKGRDGGLASDLEHLRELVTAYSYKKLIEQVDRQKNDGTLSEIEFPNLFGDKPIVIQKSSKLIKFEFALMKTLYTGYFKLLWGCIDHLNEAARPIYRTLGIIECFPDKLDKIDPYMQKPEEKSSVKA